MKEIPLTQGQFALVDDDDFELLSRYKWHASWSPHGKCFYARTNICTPDGKRTVLLMHRLIMDAKPDEQVDHINHFTLDNRKSELRLCTQSQNQNNRRRQTNNKSGHKGVYFNNRNQTWRAQICVSGVQKYLGYFVTIEEAAAARATATLLYHGEFGRIS